MTKRIIGIGNAIVDVVCEIDDAFLQKNSLIKGSMSLISENIAQNLSELNAIKITSGGSVANSIAAISQLGCETSFIGKVAMDHFGRKFISEIQKNGTNFVLKSFANSISAKSFILVSEDAQRTMCTFLGCASEIGEQDIDESEISSAAILYLEGYLWDQDSTILALKKAINCAKRNGVKIAFTLSDSFCVSRHKKDFAKLIAQDLDILFANEDEMKEMLGVVDIEENNFAKLHEFFAQNKKLTAVITRSEKGCVVFSDGKHHKEAAQKVEKLIDTTGAGDCFAAGFLFGLVQNYGNEKSAQLGNEIAAKIIQKFGARFDDNEI